MKKSFLYFILIPALILAFSLYFGLKSEIRAESTPLKASPLTPLSKTVYTNQYAIFKVQVENTSSSTVTYNLRAGSSENLDKVIITPRTLALRPNTSRTIWIFARDKDPGNYQISVEAANSSQQQLFTLTGVDLLVKSRLSRGPSVTPVSPPKNEIPSPPAPVTSGGTGGSVTQGSPAQNEVPPAPPSSPSTPSGGATSGGVSNVVGVPGSEKTVGVPGLTPEQRQAAARPQTIWNPYAQAFQDQYKGIYSGSIASQYQNGIYMGNTTQYEGKTLVVAKRCLYHHTLADPGFAFGAYNTSQQTGEEAFATEYSKCSPVWVDASTIRYDAQGHDLDACSSDAQCVQKALSIINQVRNEIQQNKANQTQQNECLSGETHCIGKTIWTCVNGKWQTQPCPTYCNDKDRCQGVNDTSSGSRSGGGSTGGSTSATSSSSGGGGGFMFHYNYLPPVYFNLPFAFMPPESLLASFSQIWAR